MAPSPRKRAVFAQTWHETDATFLDPTSLPVSKVPRGWERRAETVTSRDGKQKKVWRRYTTRSKTTNTASTEEDDDEAEEQDARYRPVKKLQRVGPRERELNVVVPKSNKRAFKATRWDRRKSVLPRKNAVPQDPIDEADDDTLPVDGTIQSQDQHEPIRNGDSVEEDDASTANNSELDIPMQEEPVSGLSAIIENDRRRSTFTFSVETSQEEQSNQFSAEESLENVNEASEFSVDVVNEVLEDDNVQIGEDAQAPTSLNRSDNSDEEVERLGDPELSAILQDSPANLAVSTEESLVDVEETTTTTEESVVHTDGEVIAVQQLVQEECDAVETSPHTILEIELQDDRDHVADIPQALDVGSDRDPIEDTEMSEFTLDLNSLSTDMDSAPNDMASPSQEESTLTEASLQLELQQDWNADAKVSVDERDVHESPEQAQESGVPGVENDETLLNEMVAVANESSAENQASPALVQSQVETSDNVAGDIADGLSLMSSVSKPRESTSRRLRSPSPPPRIESGPDDATATMYLDDDTALLKDFLTRAAASKADKAATIVRRSSLQNRRDSDAVRQALASPRKVLEDKDPNSPSKYDNDVTLDLSQTLTLNMDDQPPLSPTTDTADPENKASKNSRRSTRTRKSRLPAPPSATQPQGPKSISLRRTDGGEPVVLKRTEAQQLNLLTRNNTRKNKQGAMSVNYRLLKLNAEALSASNQEEGSPAEEVQSGKKNVRWDETLAYFQEHTDTLANIMAEAESLATPDELSMSTSSPATKKVKEVRDKNATPRMRRVRGLGAANGTPGKGLLVPASSLSTDAQEETDADATDRQKRLPKSSKIKKLAIPPSVSDTPSLNSPAKKVPLPFLASPAKKAPMLSLSSPAKRAPPLEIAPIGIDLGKDAKATKERKSRLATPKKVKLPQPGPTLSNVPVEGKENQQAKGIGGASPKKGLRLPQPQVVIPAVAESGLPRRRAPRKL